MSKRILTKKLFRQQAVDEQKDRLYGEVVLNQPPSAVLITLASLLVVACSLILLITGSYSRRMPVDGYLSTGTETRLQAELFVPARSAGLISSGQQVLIRYQAYPSQHYGLQPGIVKTVTNLILSPKKLPISININEPVYRVVVDIDEQHITAYGKQFPLQAGMLISADIVLQQRTLAQLLLKPMDALSEEL